VRDLFNSFIADHPDGKMKMKTFREMISKVGVGGVMLPVRLFIFLKGIVSRDGG
jgi:hypothetical protein